MQPNQPLPERPNNPPSIPPQRGNFDFVAPRPYAASPPPAPRPQPQQPATNLYPTSPFAPPTPPASDPQQPVVSAASPEPTTSKPKSRMPVKKIAVALIGIIILLAIGIGATVFIQNSKLTPQKLLSDALLNSFATPHVVRTTTQGKQTSTVTFDYSSATNPRLSGTATIQQNGSLFGLEVYGSPTTTTFKYTSLPDGFSGGDKVLNSWVPLRQAGTLPAGINGALSTAADPRFQSFSHVVFGNFPLTTRRGFAGYVTSHHVYSYNPLRVSKTSFAGKPAWAYPITENIAQLKILIQSVAVVEGFTPADVKSALDALGSAKTIQATLYVSPASRTIVGYSNQTMNMTFASNGQAVDTAAPTPATTWQAFAPLQAALESQADLLQSNADRDSERKADIDALHAYIEKYQASTGLYPTLANMNDQVWVSANMQGIDPDVFKDPSGNTNQLATKPVAKQFAYQPGTATGAVCDNNRNTKNPALCTSYSLSATLSTGSLYTVKNLQ